MPKSQDDVAVLDGLHSLEPRKMVSVPLTCRTAGTADGKLVELGNVALVSAVDSMGADLVCNTGVDELPPVVFVPVGDDTVASVVVDIVAML